MYVTLCSVCQRDPWYNKDWCDDCDEWYEYVERMDEVLGGSDGEAQETRGGDNARGSYRN